MKQLSKRILPDLGAIIGFITIVTVYFFTPVTKGLTLAEHDHTAGIGAGHERIVYNQTHDDTTLWTNALFGGMPTYQIAPSYPSTTFLGKIQNALGLWMPRLLTYVFLMLLGFYIMLRAFGFRVWTASLGAVMWAFSSYFFIIIAAGHLWKLYALAYLPALIGGVVLVFRGQILLGGMITALFTALEVNANHVQMTYYFLPVIATFVICAGIDAWRKADHTVKGLQAHLTSQPFREYMKRCAVCAIAALIGICINISNLYHTYDYSKHTMRAKSELTSDEYIDPANRTDSGLDRDYITQWSYGIDETWSLLVPKINGGSSMDILTSDKTAMKHAERMYKPVYQSLRQYFGDQPFTAGPVYVGAIVLMLAILALITCRGPLTWGLFALTLLSIGLSWGHNCMWLTNLFLDYVPMYDKFRTVSSILVVAEFTIPLMAILALRKLTEDTTPSADKRKKIIIAGGVITGIAALIALFPDMFVTRFVSLQEQHMLQEAAAQGYISQDILQDILANLNKMRHAVVSADAWRSAAFIICATVVLLLNNISKIGLRCCLALITVLCLIDMWTIDKRYLNDSMFRKPTNIEQAFAPTQTDEIILADTALDYRVLNLAGDTFNENQTSYHHKSVGGYHAAKLRQYQELTHRHTNPQINSLRKIIAQQSEDSLHHTYDVINMLNTRWFILPLSNGETLPFYNKHAFGNAWFVDSVCWVSTADEEIAQIGEVDLQHTAIVNRKFEPVLKVEENESNVQTRAIRLTRYSPNALEYKTMSPKDEIAVLSEIYYPDWRAELDGKEIGIARANYVLRVVAIPAGTHTLSLFFKPRSIIVTETIAWCAWAILALIVCIIALRWLKQKRHKTIN